jgi:hemerythrin-like domain-containing protein
MSQGLIQNIDDVPRVMARLLEDHQLIGQVMHRLEHEIDGLQGSEVGSSYLALDRIVEYMADYADVTHHPLEDRLFDRLLHKGVSPTERHLVFQNLGQHQQIFAATRALQAELELRMLNDSGEDALELLEHAEAYLRQQRRHMSFEETHLFPLAQYHLQNSDWNALAEELGKAEDADKHPEANRQREDLAGLCRLILAEPDGS